MASTLAGIPLLPLACALVAFAISAVTSLGGVSGAFLLLPFQVSILGVTGFTVTPTNHLFNVVAIPSGVYRYVREGRMLWPLTLIIAAGTIPGVVLGSLARIHLLGDPRHFKLFAGLVLLLIGGRMLKKLVAGNEGEPAKPPDAGSEDGARVVQTTRFDAYRLEYRFGSRLHAVSVPRLVLLAVVIGLIGGAYGVGGGAIMAPFLVSLFGLPVHSIAGATLFGTCLTSVVGVGFFTIVAAAFGRPELAPNWTSGLAFGAGGILGMYTGARLQKRVPARAIGWMLALLMTGLALSYVVGYFVR